MIVFKNDETATSFINDYSPEHYIICVKNESYYLNRVRNAGSVFIGNYTPESAGDYASEQITPFQQMALLNNTVV